MREWKVELHFLTFNINSQFSAYFYSFLYVWDSILTTLNSFPGVLNRFRLWPLYGLTLRSEAWEEGGCYNQLSLFWYQCLDPIINASNTITLYFIIRNSFSIIILCLKDLEIYQICVFKFDCHRVLLFLILII